MLKEDRFGIIFGMPVMRSESVFMPKDGDTDLFVELMKLKVAREAQDRAAKARRQKARAKLPAHVRNFYHAFENQIQDRVDKAIGGCVCGRV